MLRIGVLLLAIAATGCTSTYTQSTLASPTVKLAVGKIIAIANPANGSYGGKEYAGSGQSTATAVRAAFAKFAKETSVIAECQTVSCLTEKVGATADYLVVPEILRWEDRATEWSGIKDKLEVKLSVYDAKSGKELAASALAGKSKWATFGGDHPQDLLPDPIDRYVESLF
jgi:Domain of unknown function (DUF4823)